MWGRYLVNSEFWVSFSGSGVWFWAIDVGENARLTRPLTSRLAYMAIIDVLAVGVAQLKPEAQDHLFNIVTSQNSLKIK